MTQATVLVTGGLGAIGRWVVDGLVEEGHKVIVYSRSTNDEVAARYPEDVKHVTGDIQERERLSWVVGGYDVTHVIHLAAMLSGACEEDPASGYRTNLTGSLNVFDAAREHGVVRIVYTSGKGVYGALVGPHGSPRFAPVPEEHEGMPLHVYGSTKKALEDAVRQYRRLWDQDIIALRLGSTYGPGKDARHTGYSGLKGQIVDSALKGKPFEVPHPDLADDLVYNRDAARAHVLACFASSAEHWQFNISGGQLVTLRDFTEEVRHHCPDSRLTFASTEGPHQDINTRGRLDISRAQAELGYRPDYPGVGGVRDYVRLRREELAVHT